jgi:hypothetical protein
MLFREDRLIVYQGGTGKDQNMANDKDYLGNDKFFKINYDDRFNNKNSDLQRIKHHDEKYKFRIALTVK